MNQEPVATSKALAGKLVETVRSVARMVDVVCTIVYLPDSEGDSLRASAVAGTPLGIFDTLESIPFDGRQASARAFRSGRPVTLGETGSAAGETGAKQSVYAITSVPLRTDGHPLGALTVVRVPWRDGPLTDDHHSRLAGLADELGGVLASLAARDVLEQAAPLQLLVYPEFSSGGPLPEPAPSWGLAATVPGSAGLSWMYQLHQLSKDLNRAVSVHDVAATARRRVMEPFGASALMLVTRDDDRFWVIGHSGDAAEAVHQLHGSSAVQSGATPLADVVRGNDPYLYPDREPLADAYPEARTDGNAAMAYLPMVGSEDVVGVCCLGWAEPLRFDAEAVAVMMMAASHLAQALERIRLVENKHALAAGLQRRLLPRRVPELPGVAVAARYIPALPAEGAGGDWYDVVPLPRGRIAMIVGDVEGHGVESAAVMGQLRTAVLASVLALHERGPAAVLEHTDELLHRLDTSLMATCCIVCLDTGTGIARVANAGHPAPLARYPDGRIRILRDSVGVPLGLPIPAPAYPEVFDVALEPGALLLLYSNGIAGAADPDAVTCAHSKLAAAVESDGDPAGNLDVDEFVERLARTAPAPLRDDVIILAVEYQGGDVAARPDVRRVEIQRHDLRGVQTARRAMQDCLAAWNLTWVTDTANLVLSELVTNALIHADSDVDIRILRYPDHVRVEVLDYDVHPPIPSTISIRDDAENARAENGRGLALVDALGMDWGTSRTVGGKSVWADIGTDPARE